MTRTITITSAIQKLLPEELRNEFRHGDEKEFDFELDWCDAGGYATVVSVSFMEIDCPDLRDEIEPTDEEEDEAKMDHEQARGDYLYDCWKDEQLGL